MRAVQRGSATAPLVLEDRTLPAASLLLPDQTPGTTNPDSDPRAFITIGSQTFFVATAPTVDNWIPGFPVEGNWLCVSDGTTDGTRTVAGFSEHGQIGIGLFTNFNGTLVFTAYDNEGGVELWKSDGTTAGTVMIADITPGTEGTGVPVQLADGHPRDPGFFTIIGNYLYFEADDAVTGLELWRTDGTREGTEQIKEIHSGLDNADIDDVVVIGTMLFFRADDGADGDELWKSDGTAAGTVMVKDIDAGASSGGPDWLTVLNGTLFFTAFSNGTGRELWKSDGTAAGTVIVKDINPGSSSSSPSQLKVVNGKLFFVATNSSSGTELWTSDGTAAGTVMVNDIATGTSNSSPTLLTDHGGVLFFTAVDGNGRELWRSDGTAAGTTLVKDINPGSASSAPASMTSIGSTLYFVATDATFGQELWKTDGTPAGTLRVADVNSGSASSSPTNLVAVGTTLFFTARDATHGSELWSTDGATATLVQDINPGSADSNPGRVHNRGSQLLLTASDGTHGRELWTTDGTTAGTTLLKDVTPIAGISNFGIPLGSVGNLSFLQVSTPGVGSELWITDGTAAGTMFLKDLMPGAQSSSPGNFLGFKGQVYFTTPGGLWKTDGTPDGTVLVVSLPFNFGQFTVVGNNLFFVGTHSSLGDELWVTDGTAAGTRVIDVVSGPVGSNPDQLFNFNGTLLFETSDSTGTAHFLWKSDGTTAGTVQLKDVEPVSAYQHPASFTILNGFAYFFGRASGQPRALWKTDGTAAGTVKVDTVATGELGSNLIAAGGRLFFQGTDVLFGRELWTGTGSTGSTGIIRDMFFGSRGSNASDFIELNGSVFFVANDGLSGRELWKLNPTTLETTLVKDIVPGVGGSTPRYLQSINGTLYFVAFDLAEGWEIWESDGTDSGTVRLTSVEGAATPWFHYNYQYVNGRLVFLSNSASEGLELRSVAVIPTPTDIGLSSTVISESQSAGTAIGTLSTTDPAAAGSYSYSLVPGVGATDNGSFSIVGGQLLASSSFDFESKSLYAIRIRTTTSLGTWFEKELQIQVTDANERPSVNLTGVTSSVPENSSTPLALATVVIADDALGTNTLSLTGADAGAFEIVGNFLRLKSGVALNFESGKTSYAVTVNVDDAAFPGIDSSTDFSLAVTDIDEFDVTTPADSNVAANSVAENATSGTSVGLTVFASDADATNNTITYALTDNAGGRFTINATTGVVTVANVSLLDRESAASHSITVQATSADGSTSTQSFTINVLDVDEFDIGPITDTSGTANTFPENSLGGTPVGITAFASDADATNSSITYSLTDDAGGRFQIDPASGVVTVRNLADLNFESASSATIIVKALSQDGSFASQSFDIAITDANEFNVGPVTDTDPAANVVLEGVPNSSVVTGLLAFASDADGTTNTITYSLVDNAGGRFAIDPALGFVTVLDGSLLDYETATSNTITVRATSEDGSFSDQVYTIQVADADEFNVSPLSDLDPAPDSVPENSPSGTPVGVTAFASDADGTTNGITYSLWNTHSGRFAIDPTTGVVTVANGALLNREAEASWAVTVLATSQDGSVSVKQFVVQVADVNEFKVGTISDINPAANSIVENCPTGTLVGITGLAVDPDATTNSVTYSLFNTRGGRFAIDLSTGVITVANGALIDREAGASWTLTIVATSSDGSVSVKDFVVAVQDVDEYDVGQVFDQDPSTNSVLETAPGGTSVGITGFGVDLDSTNSTITYALTDNAGGRFAINPTTGVVTVAQGAVLDRETAASWPITIQARSADGSVSTKVFTIAISDADEFAVGPISDINAAANAVSETAPAGTDVGITARAVDPDATKSAVTYSLMNNAGGRFAINGTTGVITVANSALLDREASGAAASYDVTVQAKSQDGSSSTKIFTIQITDSDEFDVGPVSDANAVANTVAENSPAGTLVGLTARATDGDVSNNTVTYSLTNNAGNRFQIDPATGVVSVMAGAVLDFEAQTSWDITVRAASSDGSFSTQTFTIAVTNVFDAPRVTLSKSSVAENLPTGTVVGTLGLADSNATSPVYTLVTGTGSTDNSKFSITGTQLKTKANFDFETKSSYSIRVQMKGAGGVTVTQVFTILVTNVNEGPTGLTLNPASIAENNAVGATVGTLAGVDPDTGETLNYTLVSGTGSTDNAKFTIEGNQLKAAAVFDYETKRSYSIRVRVTDAAGLTYEKTLTISVTNGPG